MIRSGKKVFLGMSGGVDSSVSAALLKEQGFDVTGVFIKVWNPDWMECTWREDRLDAMRVAAQLNIPFKTIDLEKEYKKEVVDYMVSEYSLGNTPNPDVMCNQYIKFGGFFKWATLEGADYVATGHYAQTKKNADTGHYELWSGVDSSKDQSYFLWTLTESQVSRTLFPVGSYEKKQVRELAKKYQLPVAHKKDSQGLCFIGKIAIEDFLGHYLEKKKGAVLDVSGAVIGEHDGAFFFTLGERHGFTIKKKTPEELPYYVVGKDINKNTITVSHKSEHGQLRIENVDVTLGSTNWIGSELVLGKKYTARIRHLGDYLPCMCSMLGAGQARLLFDTPLCVASGQSVVVYEDGRCMGGGIAQ